MKLIYLIAIILLSSISIAGTINPNTPDKEYLDKADEYDSVGLLVGQYEKDVFFSASAVAINNHTILTAAHIVKDAKDCRIKFNDNTFRLEKVIIHKDFKGDFTCCDIAIAFSSQDFNLKSYPDLYLDKDESGKLCAISGYGLSGNFKTGKKFFDDNKRAGFNHIDYIENDLLVCTPSDDLRLEFLICGGDSGGGLFIDGKLAGINSCVRATDGSPNSSYTDEGCHTRISQYIPWIKEKIEQYEKK